MAQTPIDPPSGPTPAVELTSGSTPATWYEHPPVLTGHTVVLRELQPSDAPVLLSLIHI